MSVTDLDTLNIVYKLSVQLKGPTVLACFISSISKIIGQIIFIYCLVVTGDCNALYHRQRITPSTTHNIQRFIWFRWRLEKHLRFMKCPGGPSFSKSIYNLDSLYYLKFVCLYYKSSKTENCRFLKYTIRKSSYFP